MLWDGAYGFSSLSEKTRKSIRLQISLQRQHFLLSYLKDLRIGPAGVWTRDLPPNNLFSWRTERAAEIQPKPRLPSVIRVGVAPRLFLRNNTLLQNYACDHNLTLDVTLETGGSYRKLRSKNVQGLFKGSYMDNHLKLKERFPGMTIAKRGVQDTRHNAMKCQLWATKIHVTFAQAWLAQVGEHRSAKRKSAGWIPEQRLVIEPASPCFGIFDIQLKTVFIISVDVLWLFLMFDVCKVLIFYSHYVTSCRQNVTL